MIFSNKTDEHIELVTTHFKKLDVDYICFNAEDFPENIDIELTTNSSGFDGKIIIRDKTLKFSQIGSIWYRRPEAPKWEKEKLFVNKQATRYALNQRRVVLHGLYQILKCFWVSIPQNIKRAESKIFQLQVANSLGFEIPRTLITNRLQKVREFYQAFKKDGVVTKTIAPGLFNQKGKIYGIFTNIITATDLRHGKELKVVPSMFQQNIQKKIELRITVIGRKVFTAEIHSQDSHKTRLDWRHYDFDLVKHCVHKLPREIHDKCVKLVRTLELQFGAIDMIITPKNKYIFLEINPNGQWGWIEQLTGLSISKALADLLVREGNKSH